MITRLGVTSQVRAVNADVGITLKDVVALPIGRSIRQDLVMGAQHTIEHLVIHEVFGGEAIRVSFGASIGQDGFDTFFQ